MKQRVAIGSRLKELRKKNKFSQQYVAEKLFISQAAYSLIENSQNGIVSEHVIGLSNLYEVTTDFILKGDHMLIRVSPSEGFVPYIKTKVHAGYVKNSPGDLNAVDVDWYRMPRYNPSVGHRLFEVEGSSMAPTVYPGDIVICQIHHNLDLILDGSMVIVVTNESILLKRLRQTNQPNTFNFENDNPEDEEILTFEKKDIIEVMMVRGKISNVLSPHHLMDSNGKLQSMEEAIEFLKKELYSINKKLNSLKNKN